MAWWVRVADGAYDLQVLQLEARKPVGLQGEAHLKQNTGSVVEAGVSMLPEGIGYVCLETELLFSQIFLSLHEGCVSSGT